MPWSMLFACGFTCLAANVLSNETDTLAFIGLRFAEAADLGGNRPEHLLIEALHAHDGGLALVLRGGNGDLRRKLEHHVVREAQRELKLLALGHGAVTHPHQLVLGAETVG